MAETATPSTAERPSGAQDTAERPKRASGVQILGEYAGSGFKEPPSLARRADGQMVQLPPLLFEVLQRTDGRHSESQIAAEVTEQVHRKLTAEDIQFLLEQKLEPLGLVALPGKPPPKPVSGNSLLALKIRTAVLSERATARLARAFKPLFHPMIIASVVAALVVFDVWLFGTHGVAQPIRQTMIHPTLMLLMLGILVGSAAFHEAGHASGCAYGGGRPGKMGCGLYLAWPAFYTDITDSYRLDRRGRLRADLGGIYFNGVSILLLAGLYAWTNFEPLLLGAAAIHLEIAHQLIPIIRLDGYYIVSDLTGVPDLFGRIGPILRSAIPGRPNDPRVTVLKRWVRWAVTIWVLVLLPVLSGEFVLILMNLPRVYGTGIQTTRHLAHVVSNGWARGDHVLAVVSAIEMAFLLIPLVGIALMLYRTGRSLMRAGGRVTKGRPVVRAALLGVGFGIGALLLYAWIPPGHYRPIGPHERGTLAQTDGPVWRVLISPESNPAPLPPVVPSPAVAPSPAPKPTTVAPSSQASLQPTSTPSPSSSGPTASPSSSPSSAPGASSSPFLPTSTSAPSPSRGAPYPTSSYVLPTTAPARSTQTSPSSTTATTLP